MVRVGMAEVIKELLAFVISCLAQRPPHALHDQLRRQCSKTRLEPLSAVGVLLVIWAVQQESGHGCQSRGRCASLDRLALAC